MEAARQETVDEFEKILQMNGPENAHQLHHELGDIMYKYVSVERDNNGLAECVEELKKILKRWDNIGRVNSCFSAAAAPQKALTPGVTSYSMPRAISSSNCSRTAP